MRSSYKIAFLIVLTSTLWILSGVFDEKNKAADEVSDPHEGKVPLVRVQTSRARHVQDFLTVQGHTAPFKRVTLTAQTAGTLASLPFQEGEKISKGAVLIRLDSEDKPAALKKAETLLAQRELELTAAKKLSQKGFNSQVELARAQADREAAAHDLELAKLHLSWTKIKAPFSGIVEKRFLDEGSYVRAGDKLIELVDLSPLEIDISVSEKDRQYIEEGAVADVSLFSGAKVEGVVSKIAAEADPMTRRFDVTLETDNAGDRLFSGLTAEVRLPYRTSRAHLFSPALLTLNNKGELGVRIVDEKKIVRFYTVEILRHDPEGVFVTGLPDVTNLIIVGQEFVKEGIRVETDKGSLKGSAVQ